MVQNSLGWLCCKKGWEPAWPQAWPGSGGGCRCFPSALVKPRFYNHNSQALKSCWLGYSSWLCAGVPFVGLLGPELLLAWELKDKSRWKSPPGTTPFKCQSKCQCGHDTVSEMQWRLLTTAISTLLALCCLLMARHQQLSKPPWCPPSRDLTSVPRALPFLLSPRGSHDEYLPPIRSIPSLWARPKTFWSHTVVQLWALTRAPPRISLARCMANPMNRLAAVIY